MSKLTDFDLQCDTNATITQDCPRSAVHHVIFTFTKNIYRTEFKAYKDVKPAKPIKAPSQYKPPGEETNLETSYSATFKGEQVKAHPADNNVMERRRIRSLYSEPSKVRGSPVRPVVHHVGAAL